ncbi:hypothetical protein E1B77_23870 [Salmonella enterica subsp. enterica]|nr:hypothetical protein [Salmonella enterica subsp. enterica]EDS4738551.1 hypothetical protein [Salmonella enterica subsp. enterica serovar Oranienburg]
MQSEPKYKMSVPAYRARSFSNDTLHFYKIEQPVFGAMCVWAEHASLVFGKEREYKSKNKYKKNDELIVLGGNQSDSICFRRKGDFKGFTFLGYYLPVGYVPPSNKLNEYDSNDLNNEIFNSNNSTTNDVNRDDAT